MSPPGPPTSPPQDGSVRVLVIEDDPVVRFNTRSWLEDSGYVVEEAEDGERGIELVRRRCPDLVLCDLRMPGLDGLVVVRRLHEELPHLPVIVVSGTGVLGDAVEALREGAWDFVVKPIPDMAVLEHAVEAALEKGRLIRQNRRYQRVLERANRTLTEQIARIEEDADAGRRIQLQMMPPREQSFGEYCFGRALLPSASLSGDFADYFAIDPGHLGFFLADVSGHGVSSAFVTVLIKSYVQRSLERLHQDGDTRVREPGAMLRALNESIRAQRLDKYLTIFYGVIERRSGRIHYANAGHFPSALLFDGASTRYLPGRGMPVGLFPEPRIDTDRFDLPRGASLLLCSDGVLETLPGGSLAERLERLPALAFPPGCSGGRDAPCAPTRAEGLVADLGLDPRGGYPDDITFLSLTRQELA